ncbi:MAG: Agglutinin biosis protein MshP [Rhodocyclales bacterium]|nr:Agglutinin biosis protein MshP [Rhodocyclales bacterium]
MSAILSTAARQRGISTITAIFIITVLAVLAAAGLQMWRSAQDDQTLDMQAIRARSAARAGLQVAFWRATQDETNYCRPAGVSAMTLTLPNTLAPYAVTLTCTGDGDYTEGISAVYRRSLTAVACNQAACPDNAASVLNRYVEVVVMGECVTTITAGIGTTQCRETR